MYNGLMEFVVITDDERQRWLQNFDYTRQLPRSTKAKVRYFRAYEAVQTLTRQFDRERAALWARWLNFSLDFRRVSADSTDTFDTLLQRIRPQFSGYTIDQDRKHQYHYALIAPSLGEMLLDPETIVGETALHEGDLLVLKKIRHRSFRDLRMQMSILNVVPEYDVSTSDQNRLDTMLLTALDPEAKHFKFHNNAITALVLYDEQHSDLAIFLRENFDVLYQWAERLVHVRLVEEAADGDNCIRFWREALGQAEYLAYSLLGWGRSKPLSAESSQQYADLLQIDPTALPCLVLFDDILRPDKIALSLHEEYGDQLEQIFDKVTTALADIDTSGLSGMLDTLREESETPFTHLQRHFATQTIA